MADTKPISYSHVNSYSYNCAFETYLRYVLGLRNERTGLNRVWGQAVHAAIETWHLAGRTGDLVMLMDQAFINRLKEVTGSDEVQVFMDSLQSNYAEHAAMVKELAAKYASPTATKAYREATTTKAITELRAMLTEEMAKHDDKIKYTPSEDAWVRMCQHTGIVERYLAFDEKYPLATEADGTPLVELHIETEIQDIPTMALIDQVRIAPDGPYKGGHLVTDLKTDKNPLPADIAAVNYQFTHYELLYLLGRGINPAGGIRYNLRSGEPTPVPPLTEELAAEWVENIRMVQLAEQHRIYPRRRDAKCADCDYYEMHCSKNVGPINTEAS